MYNAKAKFIFEQM